MKVTSRIWLTALIIQPIIFIFIIHELAVFVIPVEILGSLPGIALFWITLQLITALRISADLKWILLLLSAMVSASFCSFIFFARDFSFSLLSNDDIPFLIPAPVSAILAVVINGDSINRHFINAERNHKESAMINNSSAQND